MDSRILIKNIKFLFLCLASLRTIQYHNGRGALAEYPEVARVDSARDQEGESGHTVCRQYFLRTSFEFADLAPHCSFIGRGLH